MADRPIITMKDINKGYMLGDEKVPVLKNINFRVDRGEYVAILEPSGSGKTTLMNIIGCMDICDSGEYYLDGQAVQFFSKFHCGLLASENSILSHLAGNLACKT